MLSELIPFIVNEVPRAARVIWKNHWIYYQVLFKDV